MEIPDTLVVRPLRAEDIAALCAIRLQPSVVAGTLALPSERGADFAARLTDQGPDDHAFVAEAAGRVVGTAGLHVGRGKQRHAGEIGMMVDEAWQGRGVGTALLRALLGLADDYLGLLRVELEVVADNEQAVHLYEMHGFVVEGRKRRAVLRPGGEADLLVMARLR